QATRGGKRRQTATNGDKRRQTATNGDKRRQTATNGDKRRQTAIDKRAKKNAGRGNILAPTSAWLDGPSSS
ncbi:MAG: hypothetical protein AAGG38_06565, partial [Planctomycetota bacterium]